MVKQRNIGNEEGMWLFLLVMQKVAHAGISDTQTLHLSLSPYINWLFAKTYSFTAIQRIYWTNFPY